MDGTAVKEIAKLAQTVVAEHDGVKFHINVNEAEALKYPTVQTTTLFSLDSVVNFIQQALGKTQDHLSVNVVDPTNVQVTGAYSKDLKLNVFAKSSMDNVVVPFQFGRKMRHEEFMISLLTKFERTDELNELLGTVSSVRTGRTTTSSDDGFSQEVEMKAGVTLVENRKLKNLWVLKTFKTFPEIEQPDISYILRVKGDDNTAEFELHECDGGRWKIEATSKVREYLGNKLKNVLADKYDRVTVL